MSKSPINIVWFKRDLRFTDHEPLFRALEEDIPVLLIYFFEPSLINCPDSNTHEVLGLGRGNVSLKIGGAQGQIFHLHAGDVIIIPAGVGHYSVSEHTNYQMVGGYPNGHAWDLKTGLEPVERAQILQAISAVEMPEKDPIFGEEGLLFEKWS